MVQCLRLCTPNAAGLGSINPWSGNWIPRAAIESLCAITKTQHSQRNIFLKKRERGRGLTWCLSSKRKNLPANAEDMGSIPGSGRLPNRNLKTQKEKGVI